MARLQLLDIPEPYIKCCLNRRSFTGDNHHLIVVIIVSRSNPIRLPHDKRIPMTNKTTYYITSVPLFAGPAQQSLTIPMLDDLLSDFLIGEAIRFEPGKQSLYFIIQ